MAKEIFHQIILFWYANNLRGILSNQHLYQSNHGSLRKLVNKDKQINTINLLFRVNFIHFSGFKQSFIRYFKEIPCIETLGWNR